MPFDVILMSLLVVIIFAPLLIARIANLAYRYRLAAMVILLMLLWTFVVPITVTLVMGPGNQTLTGLVGAMLGVSVVLIVPLVLLGRVLGRVFARRYVPSVADAIAAVVVGSTTSFVTPVLALVLSVGAVRLFALDSIPLLPDLTPISVVTLFPLLAIMTLSSAAAAWILMGWGSMPTLRQRKGTQLGLTCAGVAAFFSVILTLVTAWVGIPGTNTPADLYGSVYLTLVTLFGVVAILVGMLAAGFMHGVLASLASVFDLAAFAVMVLTVGLMLTGDPERGTAPSMGMGSGDDAIQTTIAFRTALEALVTTAALAVVYLRAAMIGQRVVSTLVLVLLALPFIGLMPALGDVNRLLLALLFLLLVLWLGEWARGLRQTNQGGLISMVLLGTALIIVPLIYLIP